MLKPARGTMLNRTHHLARNLRFSALLNEGSGDIANDTSGNNVGTLVNIAQSKWGGSPDGGALRFDGSNDYVTFAVNLAFEITNITMSVYARSNTAAPVNNKYIAAHSGYRLFLSGSTNKVNAVLHINGDNRQFGADTVVDTLWHHYVVTYDGFIGKLFVDGILQADTEIRTGDITIFPASTYRIGKRATGAFGESWDGEISHNYLYSEALSLADINQLGYNPYAMFERPSPGRFIAPAVISDLLSFERHAPRGVGRGVMRGVV